MIKPSRIFRKCRNCSNDIPKFEVYAWWHGKVLCQHCWRRLKQGYEEKINGKVRLKSNEGNKHRVSRIEHSKKYYQKNREKILKRVKEYQKKKNGRKKRGK